MSAGTFFQTNRFLTDELVNIVTAGRSGELALDLYAGVGLFSTALACNFRHTVSVESSQTAASDLQYNLPVNGKAVRAATGQYLTEIAHPSRKPGLVVVDPPRSGLGDPVTHALANVGAPRLTYVSCDPATLARDLIPLQAAGYQRLPHLPRHPPPPRTSLMISNSISAPMVALMIAAIMPEPRWMPS